jgi:hypothetical protein
MDILVIYILTVEIIISVEFLRVELDMELVEAVAVVNMVLIFSMVKAVIAELLIKKI